MNKIKLSGEMTGKQRAKAKDAMECYFQGMATVRVQDRRPHLNPIPFI